MKDWNISRCGRNPHPKDCYVSDLPLTLEEQIALTIARHFFQSFAQPASYAWINAFAEAEARFGMDAGPGIAARLLAGLQAMRRARRSVFMFNSASCRGCAAIATEHERRLMLSIHALRRRRTSEARLEIMLLCEGNEVEPVLAALAAVARALGDEHAPHETQRNPRATVLQ